MKITRRDFLELCSTIIPLVLNPYKLFAIESKAFDFPGLNETEILDSPIEEKEENKNSEVIENKISIDFNVDKIPKDFISEEYYENDEKSILYKAFVKSKEFYSQIGRKYGMLGVEISLDEKTKHNFTFRYTELKNFSNLIFNEKKDDFEKVGMIKKFKEENLKKVFTSILERRIKDDGGLYFKNSKSIYFINCSVDNNLHYNSRETDNNIRNSNNRETLENYYKLNFIHFIGNALGLKDNEIENNLMCHYPSYISKRTPKITKEQVQKINNYFE
jgi:hypothetical protein